MSGWIKAGRAGWGAITGVKPGTKFKGQSTIEEIKKKSNVKKLRSEIESFLGKNIYKSDAEKIKKK